MVKTQAITIMFLDLVASTERRARLGDDAFDDFSARLFSVVRSTLDAAGGREVSNAGDGMMVVFVDSVADAVTCALDLHKAAAQVDEDDPPRLRIGISCGEVAQDGEDFSGMPIVEAARLEAAAVPGQTLANDVVRTLVGTRRALRFRDIGALSLKGIPQPLPAVEVLDAEVLERRASASAEPTPSPDHPRRRPLVVGAVGVLGVVIVLLVVLVPGGGGKAGPSGIPTSEQGVVRPAAYSPRYTPTRCPEDVRKTVPGATCGYLVVPQDRQDPHGKQVRLLVQKAPPRTPAASTVAPNIDVCGCNDLATSLARDHATLIQIGGRGFTNSEPVLTCPEMVAVTREALARSSDDPDELASETSALAHCRSRLLRAGIDPAQYNFDTSAQDLIDLMVALHIGRADFTASDLTSAVVFDVLRRAPGAVRSVTLDNPAPPGTTELSDPVGDLAGAFDRFVTLCKGNSLCSNGYRDLPGSYLSTFNRLQQKPDLVSAPNPDDSSAAPIPVLLDGTRAADALSTALDDPTTYSLIPAAITTTETEPLIATEVLKGDYYSWHADAPWGALASYFCSYDIHTTDPNAVALAARTLPQFRGARNAHWAQWCSAWKVPDISQALSLNVASPVPMLLFRGDLSPNGSTAWVNAIERGLSNGQSLVFPTLADNLITAGPPCLSDLRRAFLADPMKRLDTAACARLSPPVSFDAPPS